MAGIARLSRFCCKNLTSTKIRPISLKFAATEAQPKKQPPAQCIAALDSMTASERQIAVKRKLFTPGPLMVSERVKRAMFVDLGKRHTDFTYVVKFVRSSLLQIARVTPDQYTVIPLNGSGTFATEATLKTLFGNRKKRILVMENGKYGQRIAEMCRLIGIDATVVPMDIKQLQDHLHSAKSLSGVIAVHCETSSGMINPVEEIGAMVKKCFPDCMYIVDGMTSFGAIPLDMKHIDFMISNSYKSLQGVPGISFVIANKAMLEKHRCSGVSLVLDIGAQYDELESTGQFLHTPPTHVMVAFKEALIEYSDNGGLEGRASRYKENSAILKKGMAEYGFKQLYSDRENPNGYIVTSFLYPNNPKFVFEEFYNRLSDAGHVISSDRSTAPNCFRIGTIGHIYPDNVRELLVSIRHVCDDMRIKLPVGTIPF